jgi:hypothetical protein
MSQIDRSHEIQRPRHAGEPANPKGGADDRGVSQRAQSELRPASCQLDEFDPDAIYARFINVIERAATESSAVAPMDAPARSFGKGLGDGTQASGVLAK